MHLADFKRPRIFLPLGVAIFLTIVFAIIFHPKFQKKMLLDYVAPYVDALSVDHIHLTPWSFNVSNLAVKYEGGDFNVETASLKYCLSSLFLLNINVKQLTLEGVNVDVSNFSPPENEEKESGIFPGVLASLDYGLGYVIQDVNVDAGITLPDQQSVALTLTGGDIRPKQQGVLNLQARFHTGEQDDFIDINNTLTLNQLKRGKFALIQNLLNIEASFAALPQAEQIDITISATPVPEEESTVILCNDEEQDCVEPESLHVDVQQNDHEGNNRSSILLKGDYDGNLGHFVGDYEITANERLVQPYLENQVIPPTLGVLKGHINFNITNLTGDITLLSDFLVTELRDAAKNEKTPEYLELKNNLRVFLLPEKQLRIVTLDASMEDEVATQPLTAIMPNDLDIPLNDIDGFLHQDNVLLDFELPDIPLKWFDFLLPEYEITDGHLTGAFRISTDKESVIHVTHLKPLKITNLTALQAGEEVLKQINLSTLPSIAYDNELLHILLEKIELGTQQGSLVSAYADTTIHLSGESQGQINTSIFTTLNVHNVMSYLNGDAYSTTGLPKQFQLNLKSSLNQQSEKITISKLNANFSKDKNTPLLKVNLLQPLILNTEENANLIANTKGTIAKVNLSDIQLDWFSAFIPDTNIEGRLQSAEFTLSVDQASNVILNTNKPFKIEQLNIGTKDKPVLKDISITLSPQVVSGKKGTEITYKDLAITSARAHLAKGSGEVLLSNDKNKTIAISGNLTVDIQAASQQPVVSDALQASISSPLRFETDYSLAYDSTHIDIDKLKANLFYTDTQPRISLNADTGIRIRTQLNTKQSQYDRARGKVTFEIQNLTPDPFVEILAAKGITFAEVNGKAVLTSDGNSLHIDSLQPFTITDIQIGNEEGAKFHPINVLADVDVTLQGEELKVLFTPINVTFANHSDVKAVDAKLDLTLLDNNGKVWIHQLETSLKIDLPATLDQPSLLPNHKLKSGSMDAVISVNPNGKIDSSIRVHNFEGSEEFPLELLEFDVDGQLEMDSSFTLSIPFKTVGKSGESDLLIEAVHTHQKDANNILDTTITGTVLYLNDILNFLNTITGKQAAKPNEESVKTDEEDEKEISEDKEDLIADVNAFWNVIPYDINTEYDIEQLFYTEFLVIHDIQGKTAVTADKLMIEDFEAHFHESPIKVDTVMTYAEGEKPYNVKINASVAQFNLKEFFVELVPDSKPRATGLFDVNFEGTGQTQNMSQLRNNLLFDINFSGKNGVFRLLDPDSVLVGGGTGFFGALGEGISYIPTGLFGAGAVPRLVKYIKEVEYDSLEVHLIRDESRNVKIENYTMLSPEILMKAEGGIAYEEGKDIIRSPVNMDVQLNFRGHGAAIMYDLDLLEKTQDELGYWEGPKVKFWGEFANTQSNLDEVISTAGKGAFLGGITRPISGLIGNVKFKWFGGGEQKEEQSK
ncbi:MAG: hypothetical protein O6852_10140 [Gammaproteobacteria bacterium]|nr:hypothetical protein [Gammaproteobacteria bacterium]